MKTQLEIAHKKIKELDAQQLDSIGNGSAKDFPAYKEQCGIRRGLGMALREIEDLLRRNSEDTDD